MRGIQVGSPTRANSRLDEQGFALVLVLTLIGVVTGVLAVWLSLVQIEMAEASLAANRVVSRRHALIALDDALTKLQEFAGPDQRVTAGIDTGLEADARYTAVWETAAPGHDPLVWLASGYARPRGELDGGIELVGIGTTGNSGFIKVPLETIEAPLPTGGADGILQGHFAWWVGDEGLKAPMRTRDQINSWIGAESLGQLRRQILQQTGAGTGFDGGKALEIAAAAGGIRSLVGRPSGTEDETISAAKIRGRFADWASENLAVLADPGRGGLRQDLSRRPELLGAAFATWLRYRDYQEDPDAPGDPLPIPGESDAESLRRRYRMVAPVRDRGIVHAVAPVLSCFLLGFNVRTDQAESGGLRPLEVRARWLISLWNPATSALVPEDLELTVSGLPEQVRVIDDSAGGAVAANFSLQSAMGDPLRIALPWTPAGRADQQSWLPGRVYTWASDESTDRGYPPETGFPSVFYTRNLNAAAGQGVRRTASSSLVSNTATVHVETDEPTQLEVRLVRGSADGSRETLAEWISPEFSAIATTPTPASSGTYSFCFFFRLAESFDTLAVPEIWLVTEGQDPREYPLPGTAFVPGANGPRPELYRNFSSISAPDRLLDRALPASAQSHTGQSYNEDTPLFEFPRDPVWSLGTLQQLHLAGRRPFAIGNTWGDVGGWNSIFDRYFVSGLGSNEGEGRLSPFLIPWGQDESGEWFSEEDLHDLAPDDFRAGHLLQSGAFNVNSIRVEAWKAVLGGTRFPDPQTFDYLAAAADTGTADGHEEAHAAPAAAHFFRFAQSAQETFRADDPTTSSTYAASRTVPPAAPNVGSAANTQLFRRGMRSLNEAEVAALAAAIVDGVRQHQVHLGPILTMEGFLGPATWLDDPEAAKQSLLEHAIEQAGLNADIAEFSSQWLTAADLMSALAPFLFVRSDTFLIRAYGDAVSLVSGAVEARAWLEARVQRLPEYLDASQSPETDPAELNEINARYGRRFRVVAFRWLNPEEV